MTLHHLSVYIKVCEHNSITAAATALHLTQPAVSRIISELESHYNVKLFDRISRRLYITDAGRKLLSQSIRVTDLVRDMDEDARRWEVSGTLHIGATGTSAQMLLPACIKKFNILYPDVSIHVKINNLEQLQKMVLNNELDLTICEGVCPNDQLIRIPLYEDVIRVFCSNQHPFANRQSISPAELTSQPFLLQVTGNSFRDMFDQSMVNLGLSITPIWESANTLAIVNGASEGIGLTVVPSHWANIPPYCDSITALTVEGLDIKRDCSIIYHKNKYLTTVAADFIKCVKDVAKNINS